MLADSFDAIPPFIMQSSSPLLDFQSSDSHPANYYASHGNTTMTGTTHSSVMSDDVKNANTTRDRKAMKRIQNRIAQRTYRSRIKQRLVELQQKVDSQERERFQSQKSGHASVNSGSAASWNTAGEAHENGTTNSIDDSIMDVGTLETNVEISHLHLGGTNADLAPAKHAQDQASPPQLPPSKFLGQPLLVDQKGFCPQFDNISLPDSPLYPPNQARQFRRGSSRDSEPTTYPYVFSNYANIRMQGDLMQDCFMQDCFTQHHTHPVSKIMDSNPSINYGDLSNQKALTVKTEDDHPRPVQDLKGMSQSPFQHPTKIPPIGADSWKQAMLAEPSGGPLSPILDGEKPARAYPDSVNSKGDKLSSPERSSRSRSDSPWGVDKSDPLGKEATIDDRFEYILECAKQVGFDGFDSLVAKYYTADFSDYSILSQEQRLSRNRHLPGILAELRDKSKGWTQWERQGYQSEILKAAEAIFVAECKTFRHSQNFQDEPFEDESSKGEGGRRPSSSPGGSDRSSSSQAAPAIKRTFQNELPNLWTLASALTTDNTALRPRDRSQTSFAAMLILCCSGHICPTQLGAYLTEYLENQQG